MEPTATDIFARVADLLARQQGYPRERITAATRLAEDTGMDGSDADEFMAAYARELGVELSTYRWYRHFGPEGCNPLWFLWPPWWLAVTRLPLTVGDLVAAARVGRWVREYPHDRRDRYRAS